LISHDSGEDSAGFAFAWLCVAQLGIRMTPAIARATDLSFRVLFIVMIPFGAAPRIRPIIPMQEETADRSDTTFPVFPSLKRTVFRIN
jgi:hypothetical protein